MKEFLRAIFRPDALQILVDWFVGNAEHILIRATPILAPLPSAFALSHALHRAGWTWAALAGGIIESVGVAAGAMIAYISAHNERYPGRQIDHRIGYGVFGFYVFVAAALIFGFETMPAITDRMAGTITDADLTRSIVPLLFPGLTLIGAVIVALREYMRKTDADAMRAQERSEAAQDMAQRRAAAQFEFEMEIKRREAEQALELQRLQAEQKMALDRQRAEARLSTVKPTPVATPVALPDTQPTPVALSPTPVAQRRAELLRDLSELMSPDDINKAELGRRHGVTRSQIAKDIDALVAAGKLSINGKVEVTQ